VSEVRPGFGDKNPEIKRTHSIANLVKKKERENPIKINDTKSVTGNPDISFNAEPQLVIDPANKRNTIKQEEKGMQSMLRIQHQ